MADTKLIEKAYELAKQSYAALGVDSDKAMEALSKIPEGVQHDVP